MPKSLLKMHESELRDLLIRLFVKMGYQEVELYHWGPLEQGKDIVMWKYDEAGVRRNFGVVVKAGRVQSAGANIVFDQVRQCLNDPFVDSTKRGKQHVHQCYIVAPEIAKEARNSLNNLLGSEFGRSVTYLHGPKLRSLIHRHLGNAAIAGDLMQIGQRLADLDEEWDVIPTVGPDRLQLELRPKATVDSPRPLSVGLEFHPPDSPEGRKVQDLLEEFKKTGAPVSIEGNLIKSLEFPDFLKDLLDATDQQSYGIELSQQTDGKPVTCQFAFEAAVTEQVTVLQPVVLEVVQAGTHEVTLSNEKQQVPWAVKLIVGLENGGYGRFRLDATLTGASASRASELVAFARALSVGGKMTVRSVDHDCQLATFEVAPLPSDGPFDDYTQEFCDAAKSIQDATGQLLVIPDRDLTAEEQELVFRVARIVRDGREEVTDGTVPMELKSDGVQKAIEALGGDEPVILYVKHRVTSVVLDTQIDLGPRRITWTQQPLGSAQIQELREAHRSLPEDEIYHLEVSLKDVGAVAIYESWTE